MITVTELAEVCTAAAAVLGSAGAVLRYTARIATVLESAVTTGKAVAHSLEQHIEASDRRHEALVHEVQEHATQLAVLAAARRQT